MSFLSKADPPQPPNPIQTAAAQTGTNISTAIANAFLNNMNQITPTGHLEFNQTGNFPFTDPTTGQSYNIPRFTLNQSLSIPQQAIADNQETAKLRLATMGSEEAARLGVFLGSPFDISQAPRSGDPQNLLRGDIATNIGNTGDITKSYGPNDYSQDRSNVEQALFERLQPQLDRDRSRLEQQLSDQGIRYGSPAYAQAMGDFNRQLADTRLDITARAGEEQARMQQMAQARGTFENAAQQQAYMQALGRGQFQNLGLAQELQRQQAALSAQNALRGQYLQEQYALRGQPVNEISALLSGSQVTQPSFITTQQSQIPTTDIAGLINQNFNQQFQNTQLQNQNANALLGGILGFGGNVLRGTSDRRVKENIGKMGTVLAADDQGESRQLPIYEYSFKNDPASIRHVGPMAQDVENIVPGAVSSRRGVKQVDHGRVMGSILRASHG